MEQSLNQYVDTLFTNMEMFSQKDGLIGKPVTQGDKTFMPVMSITLGYGGGDTHSKGKIPSSSQAATSPANMAGGALGLGAKLCADAVIVIDKGNVLMAPIAAPGGMSQMINKIPQIIGSMGMGGQQGGQQNGQSGNQPGGQQSGQSNTPMGG